MSQEKQKITAGDAKPPQIVPGWYWVKQQERFDFGDYREVGILQVSDLGSGRRQETWFLYAETQEANRKFAFVSPGSSGHERDRLQLELSDRAIGAPTSIDHNIIDSVCEAPRFVNV